MNFENVWNDVESESVLLSHDMCMILLVKYFSTPQNGCDKDIFVSKTYHSMNSLKNNAVFIITLAWVDTLMSGWQSS